MSRFPVVAASLLALSTGGCDPQYNIAGAFFPAWLACTLGALVAISIIHGLGIRLGFAAFLRPSILVYPCLFIAFACALWLVFFAR